jgi:cellulose synthase/poly-beta-1,6-N-acetylglucosamine synthase-like glycosyltransferase
MVFVFSEFTDYYLLIAYNEDFEEMYKTLTSLLQNIEFFKKEVLYIKGKDDTKEGFSKIVPVIVPIFDGTKALSKSMKKWINDNFPLMLNELEPRTSAGSEDPFSTEVRVGCTKWSYPYLTAGQHRFIIPQNETASQQTLRKAVKKWNTQNREKSESNNRYGFFNDMVCYEPTALIQKEIGDADELEGPTDRPLYSFDYFDDNKTTITDPSIDGSLEICSMPSLRIKSSRQPVVPIEANGDFDEPQEDEAQQDFDFPTFLQEEMGQSATSVNCVDFYLCPIIKRSNHRKHNSHLWFFNSICAGLEDTVDYVLLTDCGTTYDPSCLANLIAEISTMNDLIGVTARQRVELPGRHFHPCETSPLGKWFEGSHEFGSNACWKCWVSFALSPGPLQGIEIEGSCTISLAMFNLVEALPVMPGPCQLMNWQKMKEYHIVEEYFNLLLEGEEAALIETVLTGANKRMTQPKSIQIASPTEVVKKTKPSIDFTEFLRVNMRLAEDRILTFVSIFSTGLGTKWATGKKLRFYWRIYFLNLVSS